MKKAQVSIEFLLNFLVLLVLLSVLLAALAHLFSSVKAHGEKVLEKARIEEFARTLDAANSMHLIRFFSTGNYTAGNVGAQGAIAGANGEIYGYTIYGIGEDGEPV